MKALRQVILAAMSSALALSAAEPGDSVVVVYNSRMPESKAVAAHYADVRHVPAQQVLGFALPTGEDMTRAEYRSELQEPLLSFLETAKLFVFEANDFAPGPGAPLRLRGSRIRYAVLCFGVPLRILDDPTLVEPEQDKLNPAFRGRNGAAVDSELALLPLTYRKPLLTGPLRNPCYGVTNAAELNPGNAVLMVARLDGPDAGIARHLVDKAIQAETNGLWGRAYFDLRGLTDGDYKPGDDWIRAASETTRRFGFATVVDEKPETFPAGFPMSQIALYAGWYDPNADGPFALPKVEFMPGAFAYHLQSYSAHTLRSTTLNWCGPLLAKGATATMGCVDEPYLQGTPNVELFFYRWLVDGFTFGEAAYACQPALSWETTVVGDPLYRPFGKKAQAQYQEMVQHHSPWVPWSILRWVDINLANNGSPLTNLVHQLEVEPATRQSAILAEKLAELYRLQDKPEAAIKELRLALTLHPTPQTVVRLTLELGDQLSSSGKDADALKLYDEFQKSNPAYPGALDLYQKMESLALKLDAKRQAARYAEEIKKRTPEHR